MLRTRVGYCGGDKEKPHYYAMGDHTEAISVDFDPTVISYSELMSYFWRSHLCDLNNSRTQYMNAVFYRNEEQKKLAQEGLVKQAAIRGISPEQVQTKILPVKVFTYAEMYHQKYAISGEIRDMIDKLYPSSKTLADSTIATRLNAHLGNGFHKDRQKFLEELGQYGFPAELEAAIRKRLR